MTCKKILITGSTINGGLPNSLSGAFKKAGLEVVQFDDVAFFQDQKMNWLSRKLFRYTLPIYAPPLQRALLETVRIEQPDLILVLKGFYFKPATIEEIKVLCPKAKLLYFNPDNPFNTWHYGNSNQLIIDSMSLYDLHLSWSEDNMKQIKAHGAKDVVYFPFACETELHFPVELEEKDKETFGALISFIGSWDTEREAIVRSLLEFDLKIWGNSWYKAKADVQAKWTGREVVGTDFNKVVAGSKINLNILRKQNAGANNMRTFEIPASKGFMIATDSEEHRKIFESGKEIDLYNSLDELREKIVYYSDKDGKRCEMAEAAYQKVLKKHTYAKRVKGLLNYLEEK